MSEFELPATLLPRLTPGDAIEEESPKEGQGPKYTHWGIFIGGGLVVQVHNTEVTGSVEIIHFNDAFQHPVRVGNLDSVADTWNLKRLPRALIVKNAISSIGDNNNGNCKNSEYFVASCTYGVGFSAQAMCPPLPYEDRPPFCQENGRRVLPSDRPDPE